MQSLRLAILPFILGVLMITQCYAADPRNATTEITAATVFRNGAELTHKSSVLLARGDNEVIFEGISNALDQNSIQIKAPAGVTIMSIEFGQNMLVLPLASARIQMLKDSVETVQDLISALDVKIRTNEELLQVLHANKDIKGQQTGLSVDELKKMMDYYKLKSLEIQQELAQLKSNRSKWLNNVTRFRAQIIEEESKNTRTRGQLRVQLQSEIAGAKEFTISYITPNAYWKPVYEMRVENIRAAMKIIYKGGIVQTTGNDWKKVKLTLSTAAPNQYGQAPILRPWFLSYVTPIYNRAAMMNSIQAAPADMLQGRVAGVQLEEVAVVGYGSKRKDSVEPLYIVNGTPMEASEFSKISPSAIKSTEVLKDNAATSIYGSRASAGAIVVTLKDGLDDYVTVTDSELNANFEIDLPYDVPTNGKAQLAVLTETTVPTVYKFYSVPKLDRETFLLAELADWGKLNLLPGEASIMVEGTFVGNTFIDPNTANDTLNLTLGRDKKVVVDRKKIEDFNSTKFLGSTTQKKITYELTVRNNKKDTIVMLLKDQFPISTDKDIEIELVDTGGAEINKEVGVLTWKLKLAPGTSQKYRFIYSVKHPKDKNLVF